MSDNRSMQYAEILSKLIRVETISSREHQDINKFLAFHEVLRETYPKLFSTVEVESFDGSLLLKWKGTDPSLKPIMIMNHHDVVEASGEWTHPAFSGEIADGKVWGRGTLDTKGGLAMMFQAAEELIKEGFTPNRDIYFITACTEEIGGEGGDAKEEVTYVLDTTADLPAIAQGDKADGEIAKAGTDSFFTIHYSAKTKIDSSNKTFDDGYKASQRINFGAKTNTSNMNNSIEFTVTDAAKITIWWVSNGDGRQTVIFNANGEVVKTTENSVKNSLYIDSFELEAGTYYIGTADGGSNYTFKVEVETTK